MTGSRPWEADRPLTLETARAAIGSCFPEVDTRTLEHLGSGWEFDAFVTGDGWVFRFPRRAGGADLFDTESRVLDLASRALPRGVAVPRVELVGRPAVGFPYGIAGHRLIPGVAADLVDDRLLLQLARDIGSALQAIHAIPEASVRAAGVGELALDEEGRREWVERELDAASRLRGIDAVIDGALDWTGNLSWPIPSYEGPLRFIHHDLSPEHVIVDPGTGRLAGIIDWTDAILNDPARDFVFLVAWRGWPFAEEVLREYPMPLDAGFRERLGFLARLLSVIWLGIAHEQAADVSKHIEWVRNAFSTRSA